MSVSPGDSSIPRRFQKFPFRALKTPRNHWGKTGKMGLEILLITKVSLGSSRRLGMITAPRCTQAYPVPEQIACLVYPGCLVEL